MSPAPSAIICADWSRDARRRAVYAADVSQRTVRRLPATAWSLSEVLTQAERLSAGAPVLATFDVPLGVPESYLAALAAAASRPAATFLDFLRQAARRPQFFDGTSFAAHWRLDQPFLAVPAGEGGLTSYIQAARRLGVDLYRTIDRQTGAKSLFVTSGIPGSVGSATCALWQELAPRLTPDRTFKVWPFEGDLNVLLRSAPVVVGEMYPRAAYATALLDVPPSDRPPLVVAKTDPEIRRQAITQLRAVMGPSARRSVRASRRGAAIEDDFDACLTAAALLRCILEPIPVSQPLDETAQAEGGILGTGSINLASRGQTSVARPLPPDRDVVPAAETVTPPPRVGLIRRLLQRWTGTPATPQSSAAAVPTPVPAAAILPPIPPLRPGPTGPIAAAEILRFLNDQEVRATYRAVGDVLGVIPRSVGSRLGSKRPEASWVVSAATGDPSGYSRAERHPALYRRSTIITSGAELRTRIAAWRARRAQ